MNRALEAQRCRRFFHHVAPPLMRLCSLRCQIRDRHRVFYMVRISLSLGNRRKASPPFNHAVPPLSLSPLPLLSLSASFDHVTETHVPSLSISNLSSPLGSRHSSECIGSRELPPASHRGYPPQRTPKHRCLCVTHMSLDQRHIIACVSNPSPNPDPNFRKPRSP